MKPKEKMQELFEIINQDITKNINLIKKNKETFGSKQSYSSAAGLRSIELCYLNFQKELKDMQDQVLKISN